MFSPPPQTTRTRPQTQTMRGTRASCTLKASTAEHLLKAHVRSLEDEAFKSDDPEEVVDHYLALLCGIAQHTQRLSKTFFAQAVVRIFGVKPEVASKFAMAVSEALAYCFQKGSKATTGKELSEPVKTVCKNFRCEFEWSVTTPRPRRRRIHEKSDTQESPCNPGGVASGPSGPQPAALCVSSQVSSQAEAGPYSYLALLSSKCVCVWVRMCVCVCVSVCLPCPVSYTHLTLPTTPYV